MQEIIRNPGTPDPATEPYGCVPRSLSAIEPCAMSLENIIKPDGVLCNATARSKKHCLEILSELLVRATPDIASELIFESLIERERLGCTSLDRGAAFPHCRVAGIDASNAALMKLSEPVDFDAADGEPVDLVLGMMVPLEIGDQHRADITLVTSMLADEDLRDRLRGINSSSDLYRALIEGASPSQPEDSCRTNSV